MRYIGMWGDGSSNSIFDEGSTILEPYRNEEKLYSSLQSK